MSALPVRSASYVRNSRPERQPASARRDLTAKLAVNEETRRDAFAVRYQSYFAGGYIDPRKDGIFADPYDDMPNSRCMVIYQNRRPVASVRVCIMDAGRAGWDQIPAANIFPDDVQGLLAGTGGVQTRPARAIEINRLVRHPDFTTDFTLVFALFRLATFMVYHYETDVMLSCVRRNHASFYKRLHFHHVSGPRRYAGVNFETNLMACYQPSYDHVLRDVPIVDSGAMQNGCYDGLFAGEAVSVFGSAGA